MLRIPVGSERRPYVDIHDFDGRRLVLAAMLVGLLGLNLALAQACERGTLDARFCDADGDLLADVPSDPAELVDPDVLIFAYTPVEDPAVYAEVSALLNSLGYPESGSTSGMASAKAKAKSFVSCAVGRLSGED